MNKRILNFSSVATQHMVLFSGYLGLPNGSVNHNKQQSYDFVFTFPNTAGKPLVGQKLSQRGINVLVVTVKATDTGHLFNLGIQGIWKRNHLPECCIKMALGHTQKNVPPTVFFVATTFNTSHVVFVLEFFIRIYFQCQHLHHNSQTPHCGVDIQHSIPQPLRKAYFM